MSRPHAIRIAAIGMMALAVLAPRAHASGFESLGPDGGRIDGFTQSPSDPDRLYCHPYRQGVFRSDDHGASWQRVDTGIALDTELQRIAVSPSNKNLVLVGDPANDRLLRSTDGGVSWSPVAIAADWSLLSAMAFDPHFPTVVLASIGDGPQSGLRRSTNAGLTWSLSSAGMTSTPRVIVFHPGLAGVVLAGTGAGIFRSTNGGGAWSQVATGSTVSLSCAGVSPVAWAITVNQVLRSNDNGLTFAPVTQPPGNWEYSISTIAASPVDPSLVLVGQLYSYCTGDCSTIISAIYRSTNGGVSWEAGSYEVSGENWKQERFNTIVFDAGSPTSVWVGITNAETSVVKNGLVRSTNSGATFSPSMNGIHGQSILALSRDDAGAVYARRDGKLGLWFSADAGDAWEEIPAANISSPICFESNRRTPGLLLEAGVETSMDTASTVCARSTNGGQTWTGLGTSWEQSLVSIPSLLRSNHGNGGVTYIWADEFGDPFLHRFETGDSITTSNPVFYTVGAVLDPSNDLRLFAVDRSTGEVKLSTDGGVAWTPRASGLPFSTPIDLFLDPSDAERLAVVYETAGGFRSDDGGLSWSAVSATQVAVPAVSADWDPVFDRFAIVTQTNGVFVTGMGLVTEGLTTRELADVVFEPVSAKVLVGTKYASVFGLDVPAPTAAPEVASVVVLQLQTQPNPFRRDITIRLSTPVGRSVAIEVVSVDGRRVVDLYRGVSASVTLDVSWNGRDASNSDVAPGVYFVRARVGDETTASRIVKLDR